MIDNYVYVFYTHKYNYIFHSQFRDILILSTYLLYKYLIFYCSPEFGPAAEDISSQFSCDKHKGCSLPSQGLSSQICRK